MFCKNALYFVTLCFILFSTLNYFFQLRFMRAHIIQKFFFWNDALVFAQPVLDARPINLFLLHALVFQVIYDAFPLPGRGFALLDVFNLARKGRIERWRRVLIGILEHNLIAVFAFAHLQRLEKVVKGWRDFIGHFFMGWIWVIVAGLIPCFRRYNVGQIVVLTARFLRFINQV